MTIYALAVALHHLQRDEKTERSQKKQHAKAPSAPLRQVVKTDGHNDCNQIYDIEELLNDIDFATRVLGSETSVPDDLWEQICETFPDHFQQSFDTEGKPTDPLPAREVCDRLLTILQQGKNR